MINTLPHVIQDELFSLLSNVSLYLKLKSLIPDRARVVEKNLESLKMCPYLRGLECHLALIQHSAADMCYVQVDTVLKIRSR